MNSYRLKVTNAGIAVAMSPCRSDDRHVHLLVEDLSESSYNFTIISSNSIGEQSTAAIPFSKKDMLQQKCQMRINNYFFYSYCLKLLLYI